ncbi:hypothetical protein PPYR_12458 [Photinus pyralis]|uniref:beta-N-acetylhexosaminidase n=2 Tax=Photinus pyralis TaxID=7054 RepID=A0A1Y1M6D7_PHOPY|nr:hexosaminidase D-like [Photinus pyralis]XP_031358726.1 hexosaminidase D-like [Photinus pyralis]KAB0790321.1 hypothetical protein PPYR_15338 [Photinus pyralis]KAB0795619.1 hypothetical protein PPYR_12458 [Photinus pyralis]
MKNYIYHVALTVWRKKTSMLIVACLLVLLMLGLQFSQSEQENARFKDDKDQTRAGDLGQFANVKFLESLAKQRNAGKLTFSDSSNKESRKGLPENDRSQQELEKMLGIPFVNLDVKNPYIPKQRIIHLDLKGAPPKVAYLRKIFPLLKTLGATGLLIEYEDMFPYSGILKEVKAGNAYSVEDINQLLTAAEESKLEVIPLIQTFGHLEFALKHNNWSKLREVSDSPQALCPNRNGTMEFIMEMLKQMLELHPKISYLHIGCDEVFQMGECEICRLELHENLFLRHVSNVANLVRKHWPHLRLIIWDDMLRHLSQQSLQDFGLGELVEPMVWVYAEDIYRFVQSPVWDKYASVFKTAWTASAFKGAFGESLYVPDARRHLENNLRWLDVMSQQNQLFKQGLSGIILTGWQRYDHFAILCELFPASLPSLSLNLLAVSTGYFNLSLKNRLLSALSCPEHGSGRPTPFIALEADPHLWDKMGRCMFPGSPVFRLMYRLHNTENEVVEYLKVTQQQKGWLTAYNVRRNYSLPLRIDELTSDLPRIYHSLLALNRAVVDSMNDIFDHYTIGEWIEQRIYPYIVELEKIQNQTTILKTVNSWPSRPLPPLKDLQRLGVTLPEN